tara:strand:+ start:95 stop:373 length:279 start_codon:yes stop_codon:yes gene_type:complete
MNKMLMTSIFTLIIGLIVFIPNKSEAGVKCSYDFFGNYNCVSTGNSFNSESNWKSSTKKDFFGNDVTTFSNNSGQTGTMTCKTDFFGNYVCN